MAEDEDVATFCDGDCGFNEFLAEWKKDQTKEIGDEKDTPNGGWEFQDDSEKMQARA